MAGQPRYFDVAERMRRLTGLGDQLQAYAATVDVALFRPELDAALCYLDGAKGGRRLCHSNRSTSSSSDTGSAAQAASATARH